jgi:hypothetical protein
MIGHRAVEAHNSGDCGSLCGICDFEDAQEAEQVYGMCLSCRSIEVALDKVIGTRDFSDIGEASNYPVGYGCEVCG